MLVSVIIPVYNTPVQYFQKCIESIMNDTSSPIEVIVVNDGSDQDKIGEYRKVTDKYDCIRIISQENMGVSAARNRGIDEADGEYIAFVDADDEIENHFIDDAVFEAELSGADIIVGKVRFFGAFKDQNISVRKYYSGDNMRKAEDALLVGRYIKGNVCISGSPCAKLYRTSYVKSVKFDKDINYFEDQVFNIEIFHSVQSLLLVPCEWYIYRDNQYSSVSKMRKSNFALLCLPFFERLYIMISDDIYALEHENLCAYAINMVYDALVNLYGSDLSQSDKTKTEKKLYSTNLIKYLNSFRPGRQYGWKIFIKKLLIKYKMVSIAC